MSSEKKRKTLSSEKEAPQVPKRIGETTETELYYKNTFTNSCLHCRYSKGAATFRCPPRYEVAHMYTLSFFKL